MRLNRRRFIQIAAGSSAGLLVPGFASGDEHVRWSGYAMGASASLTVAGRSRKEAEALIAAARAEIERMEQLFSLYRPDSALATLNRDGRLRSPAADMLRLLSTVDHIHDATNGLFDPTVQPVWSLLAKTGGRPDRAALDVALAKVGWRSVRVDHDEIRLTRAGMALTLNGIAQGYATDRVAALLKDAGLANVLVSIGEIAAIGERSPGEPWRVGIEGSDEGETDETLSLSDMSVATSAPQGTVLDERGMVGHILDPKRGPVAARWQRISVIHASAAIADGLSTGLALMPADAVAETLTKTGGRMIAVSRDGARIALGA
ncbi:FAD:protein FMN transferase [Notoacmeibacter sp. MSK16QG-6]|uniref:FAD:protein FMN transferase n=1 Tax=Notoacmeibacter sp. MSK16QG-6 TaxID=2957982 RepID=UPI00209F3FEC|nr:FAD:protein FMN transferase [Notoacmeibacter sp. MSK16QG-6]MCP1200510.1 FAD:protein FMN transferase [Notoacmeibacter sp. MSK16QG-6]